MTKIALVDDHILLRDSLANVLNDHGDFKVLCCADNGQHFIDKMKKLDAVPDVVLLDLHMPEMDGYETAIWLREHYPDVLILILTMYDTDLVLIRMLQQGVRGFLKKDILPDELKNAILIVLRSGYYYNQTTTGRILNYVQNNRDFTGNVPGNAKVLTEAELRFIKYASSEMTYKEIAILMKISPRTIDNYRDSLFEKLNVKSRTGLAIYAIKNGLIAF